MTAFREVAEAEATGDVALVFEEIRRTYAVPYVSSLFRHLAVYPGLLPWAWEILRPALLSGAAQRLAWQRVDIAELPPLPPLSREALARLGVDAAGLPAIRTVCESFARVSPINLVVAACLARLLGEGQSGAEPVTVTLEPADLPAPLPAMPGMVPAAEMTPETQASARDLRDGARGRGVRAGALAHPCPLVGIPWLSLRFVRTTASRPRRARRLRTDRRADHRPRPLRPRDPRPAREARATRARRDRGRPLRNPDLSQDEPADGRFRDPHPRGAPGRLTGLALHARKEARSGTELTSESVKMENMDDRPRVRPRWVRSAPPRIDLE